MVDIVTLLLYCKISLHICFCSQALAGGIMDTVLSEYVLTCLWEGLVALGRFAFLQKPRKCSAENIHSGNRMMTGVNSQRAERDVSFFFRRMKYLMKDQRRVREVV